MEEPRLALFDLDGTLLPWDTQLLFANFILRRHPWRRMYLSILLPCAPLGMLRIWKEKEMKGVFLSYLAGMSHEQLRAEVSAFMQECVRPWLYAGILAELRKHLAAGDRCVLVTASPELYAVPLGLSLGFHDVVATQVEMGAYNLPMIPKVVGENNKGEAKLRHLRAKGIIPESGKVPRSIAYSDSRADLPMLHICEEAHLVNPSPSLRKIGEREGWKLSYATLPWSSPLNQAGLLIAQIFGLWEYHEEGF